MKELQTDHDMKIEEMQSFIAYLKQVKDEKDYEQQEERNSLL